MIAAFRALAPAITLMLFVGGSVYAKGGPAVSIKDEAFHPASIQVRTGDAVKFTNNDGEEHTVTADNNSFDSNILTAGNGFQHKFTKAGRYSYHCKIHPFMHGVIIVK
ncbi:MAG TPA: cupredoxin domain-containing protein [Candidatus Rubrimentiphilum sp.]|nr:cupredoxin domain-containing protein [Candidatus Rubrimentiphilum sp.]